MTGGAGRDRRVDAGREDPRLDRASARPAARRAIGDRRISGVTMDSKRPFIARLSRAIDRRSGGARRHRSAPGQRHAIVRHVVQRIAATVAERRGQRENRHASRASHNGTAVSGDRGARCRPRTRARAERPAGRRRTARTRLQTVALGLLPITVRPTPVSFGARRLACGAAALHLVQRSLCAGGRRAGGEPARAR